MLILHHVPSHCIVSAAGQVSLVFTSCMSQRNDSRSFWLGLTKDGCRG